MKMIKFKCNLCGNAITKLFHTGDKVPGFLSCQCSGILEKQIAEIGTSSVEVVDNGNMQKRVELRRDAVDRFKERGDIYVKKLEERESEASKKKGN